MTRDEALTVATADALASQKPVDIWQHTGDRKVMPTPRFIARPADAPPPQFDRWTKVQRVTPGGARLDNPSPSDDLKDTIRQVETIIAAAAPMTKTRSARCLQLLKTALAMVDGARIADAPPGRGTKVQPVTPEEAAHG